MSASGSANSDTLPSDPAALVDGYRSLVHLLLRHRWPDDDPWKLPGAEAALCDFTNWVNDESTAMLLEALVNALEIYDARRHP